MKTKPNQHLNLFVKCLWRADSDILIQMLLKSSNKRSAILYINDIMKSSINSFQSFYVIETRLSTNNLSFVGTFSHEQLCQGVALFLEHITLS